MSGQPDLSVVILSWNTRDMTLACLRALAVDQSEFSREVIVVDNGSEDGSADAVAAEFPEIKLLRNEENEGYSRGNNMGAELASGRFLCLLNSDTEVRPRALDEMLRFIDCNPEYGAVGPRLVHPDGRVQPACKRFPGLFTALCFDSFWGSFPPGSWVQRRYLMKDFDHLESRDVDQPPGACFMMRRELWQELGGMDGELWLFYNDVDLCRRIKSKGQRIRYLASAEVMHHEGASTSSFGKFVVIWNRNRMAYYRKQYGSWTDWYLRLVVRMRALEESIRAGFRHKDPAARRSERAHIRGMVKEILAR
ncbi:MAG: glycosyltransferase family 2 protein [Planctomycetota bacterium]|jgi:GT2 family glycosyltransferase